MIPADLTEPEVLIGQRAFPDAQPLLAGASTPVGSFTVGWHDTAVQPYRGLLRRRGRGPTPNWRTWSATCCA